MHGDVQKVVIHLRDEHRLFLNVNYSYICKYSELHLLLPHVFADVVRFHFEDEVGEVTSVSYLKVKK